MLCRPLRAGFRAQMTTGRGPIRAGQWSTPGPPSWRTSMTPLTWAVVPLGNDLSDVDPEASATYNPSYPGSAPWHGSGGQSMVLDAWCSLVPSQDDGRLWAGPGGGHGDYAGNEMYVLDLMSESPTWSMVMPPSGALPGASVSYADSNESTGLYSDGRVRAAHNYRTMLHVPGTDDVFISCVAAPYYNPVQTAQKAWSINGRTGAQSLASDFTALTSVQGTGEGGSCYDSSRHCVWHIRNATSKIMKTDLATGVTTAHGVSDTWVGGYSCFVYVPDKDVVVNFTGLGSGYALWNPSTETWTRVPPAPTGAGSAGLAALNNGAGACWVPGLGAIALWNNSSATTELTLLTPPASGSVYTQAWALSVLSPDASNAVTPPAKAASGGATSVFGRFGYLPALKALYLQTQYSAALHVYATEAL